LYKYKHFLKHNIFSSRDATSSRTTNFMTEAIVVNTSQEGESNDKMMIQSSFKTVTVSYQCNLFIFNFLLSKITRLRETVPSRLEKRRRKRLLDGPNGYFSRHTRTDFHLLRRPAAPRAEISRCDWLSSQKYCKNMRPRSPP
jgi:hypothetical protein